MALRLIEGDIITTKKNHPCGNNEFEIMRVGIDFVIKCNKCNKQIWIKRTSIEKRIKKILRDDKVISKESIRI